jgi:peptidyl-prolyl cis-trans isomerase SurA
MNLRETVGKVMMRGAPSGPAVTEEPSERTFRYLRIFSPRLRVSASSAVFALLLAFIALGATLDRIAVSVGSQVITLRDLEREIRVAAFLDSVTPDLTAANKRTMADRMVEERLIRQEMETSNFPIPAASEVRPALDKLQKTFPTESDYRRALAQYGITEQEVQDLLLRMLTLQEFINLRFRPGVQVTDQEIRDYFDRVVAPAARAANPGQPPALEDYRTQIEEKLADQEMNNWLKDARKRTEIVFHPEALQ